MYTSKIKFWMNLAQAIATTYIIIWYIFTPSNNKCQMTFMMEPPSFLPVPVDTTVSDEFLSYPQVDIKGTPGIQGNKKGTSRYKLYMYSEFGFPQSSNVRSDLKDSMPVLFVPGNAGSYQQVRSLASTCIRRQLQSLEAFKFIFYTIDFQGQLSGISGQLIEEQTHFVHQALIQISRMHPSKTGGVILIGHSVGGFISKVLLSRPNFNSNSVPLLISLASPLIHPYLTFDDKMLELYDKTNRFWAENMTNSADTISISLSGGKLDRLVPEHLSMDPQFDISLATSSVKDVWLATDHVCITWCRELMLKLAHLLSSLMDKRETKLISDKKEALAIIFRELLIQDTDFNLENTSVIAKDWRTMRQHNVINFKHFYSASRLELSESILVADISHELGKGDLLIYIDHIGPIKEGGVFGCKSISLNNTNNQISCRERIDLLHLAQSIPSPRYEPRRTILRLKNSHQPLYKQIVFDFMYHSPSYRNGDNENKVPEALTIQRIGKVTEERSLYIPSLLEYALKRTFFSNPFAQRVTRADNSPLIYMRFNLVNLNQNTQIFSLRYESKRCPSGDLPKRVTILVSQDGYLSDSLHVVPSNKNEANTGIKISSHKTVSIGATREMKQSYIELYVEGNCEGLLKVEVDLLDLVVDGIKKNLARILTCSTYLSYLTIIFDGLRLRDKIDKKGFLGDINRQMKFFLFYVFIDLVCDYKSTKLNENITSMEMFDKLTSCLIIYILANGATAFLDHLIKRMIDLATVLNRLQLLFRRDNLLKEESPANETNGAAANGRGPNHNTRDGFMSADLDWILIGLALVGSFIFSTALLSIVSLFMLIKLELNLLVGHTSNSHECLDEQCKKTKIETSRLSKQDSLHQLLVHIAVLISLALISNIPSALLSLNGTDSILNLLSQYRNKDKSFFAAAFALLQVKFLCEKINLNHLSSSKTSPEVKTKKRIGLPMTRIMRLIPLRYSHLITLVHVVVTDLNLSNINLALMTTLVWLNILFDEKQQERKESHMDYMKKNQ